mgnify:CR=1 FL=1
MPNDPYEKYKKYQGGILGNNLTSGLLGNPNFLIGANIFGQGLKGQDPFSSIMPSVLQAAKIQQALTPKRRPKKRAYDPIKKEVVFATDIEIEQQGLIPEPKDPVITKFNTLTGTYQTGPKSSFSGMEEKGEKITDAGTQYNILVKLTDDMKSRLPNTPTKAVGLGFGITESLSDQFSQIGESLGIKETLEIKNPETIDQYLESKGFTQKAANYAKMKGSVINLGYILAKLKEPNNPRLSEGDIIRQLNRIHFGGSREVFAQSLDQILKEARIEASGLIKGLGGDPDKILGERKKTKDKKRKKEGYDPLGIL